MKLLTLSTLASLSEQLPYRTISNALEIELDEVEEYVIKTIREDLIQAKMDQLNSLVIVQ